MRTRLSSIVIICAACGLGLLPQPGRAQTVPVAPRPAMLTPPPAPVAPASAELAVVVAPVAMPAIPFASTDQTPALPPAPPAPPAPAKAPKPAAPKAVTEPPSPRAETPSSNMNVRVEVTIIDQSGTGVTTKKTVSLTVADGGRGSVRSGVTVPIPSSIIGSREETRPTTSFSYRDMGLSLDVTGATIRGNYVRLRLAVEYNPVDEKMATTEGQGGAAWLAQGPASFARFSQNLDLALESGKPLVVASSSDPVPSRNRTASLEVKATILK